MYTLPPATLLARVRVYLQIADKILYIPASKLLFWHLGAQPLPSARARTFPLVNTKIWKQLRNILFQYFKILRQMSSKSTNKIRKV